MKELNPIGVFDSGVGGLSVWRELIKLLPNESVIYFADNAHCPYGSKPQDEILQLASRIVEFLISKKCKIIIVACNTATAAAIDFLRENYSIPFIGMEPAVKPAALKSKTKRVAILATEGTLNGRLYLETSEKFAQDVELNIQVGNRLVDIVEKGLIEELETENYLRTMLEPLIEKNIDHLVLGCTHYPFLIPILQKILPSDVEIIDPAPAVAQQTKRILENNKLLNIENHNPEYQFYSSGDVQVLEKLIQEITHANYKVVRF